ncbi:gp53-like domain-containing protein, partial [Lelliottia amnigena]
AGVATGAMGTSGYAILPMMIGSTRRTFIIQWGSLSPLKSGNTVEISLPVAFPNLFMQAFATHDNATQFTRPTVYALSTTSRTVLSATATCLNAPAVGAGVTRSSDDAACFGRYIAIGY